MIPTSLSQGLQHSPGRVSTRMSGFTALIDYLSHQMTGKGSSHVLVLVFRNLNPDESGAWVTMLTNNFGFWRKDKNPWSCLLLAAC